MKENFESSVLKAMEYHEGDQTLILTFLTGKRYSYEGVPAEVVNSLLTAPSSGQVFNREIRNNYRATEL